MLLLVTAHPGTSRHANTAHDTSNRCAVGDSARRHPFLRNLTLFCFVFLVVAVPWANRGILWTAVYFPRCCFW